MVMATKAANGSGNHLLSNDDGLEAKRAEAIQWVKDHLGCAKGRGKGYVTREQRKKAALEITEEEGLELGREVGLID